MRIRAVVVVALLARPRWSDRAGASAACTSRPAPPPPDPHPSTGSPARGCVARQLRYRRVAMVPESVLVDHHGPASGRRGGFRAYTSFGNGLRGDYRYTDHWSATIDMTASYLFSPAMTQTGEFGTRYAPLPLDRQLRPSSTRGWLHAHVRHVSSRAASIRRSLVDSRATILRTAAIHRGFGAALGAGLEFPLTESLQLTAKRQPCETE